MSFAASLSASAPPLTRGLIKRIYADAPARDPVRLVNSEVARIFKRILEARNWTKSEKRFAKRRRRKTPRERVYHARIKHIAAVGGTNTFLAPHGPTAAIVKKRLRIKASPYETLQISSLTLFENSTLLQFFSGAPLQMAPLNASHTKSG
jgi:hypothetical protein